MRNPFHHHEQHEHLSSAFGADKFGKTAERIARFFGTPKYILGQTIIVILWIAFNAYSIFHFDPYPFILLNLAFSTQAAYAAPLILLAQTRQAERDKAHTDADVLHREELAKMQTDLLQLNTKLLKQNTKLTEQVSQLTEEIHAHIAKDASGNKS